jgi:hypothetical protein
VLKFQRSEKIAVKVCLAPVFWSLWKTSNKVCFEHIMHIDPCDIIYRIFHWIDSWNELQKTRLQKVLRQRTEVLKMQLKGLSLTCRRIDRGWASFATIVFGNLLRLGCDSCSGLLLRFVSCCKFCFVCPAFFLIYISDGDLCDVYKN